MSVRSAVVTWLDDSMPHVMGTARYHYHVSYRGNMVHPAVTAPLFKRLGSHQASAIDVGANAGIFTRYLCGWFATVVAVEPIPYLADRLQRSKPSNCRVEETALGDHEGKVILRVPVDAAGREMPALSTAAAGNTLDMIGRASTIEREVRMRRLDDVAAGLTNLAFVKIDVEGFEATVLAGADGLLRDTRPVIQLELGRAHNAKYGEVLRLLDLAGFDVFAMQNDGLYADAERFILEQPLAVAAECGPVPEGVWDFLFVPRDRTAELTTGLLRG